MCNIIFKTLQNSVVLIFLFPMTNYGYVNSTILKKKKKKDENKTKRENLSIKPKKKGEVDF